MNGARVPDFGNTITWQRVDVETCDKNESSAFYILHVIMINAYPLIMTCIHM